MTLAIVVPSKKSRIEFIDVLRGFTLLGIGIIHMVEQYYAGPHPSSHQNFAVKFLGDEIVSGIAGILISGKFFMIFSFLFGLSFFLQLQSSDGSFRFTLRFLWRLAVLFLIGFIHHLHYRGDILTIYAVLGLVLLATYKLPDRFILILGLLLTLNVPAMVARAADWAQYDPARKEDPMDAIMGDDKANEVYFNTLKSSSYIEIMKANFNEFAFKARFQLESGRIYITAGLFLMGLYAGRKKLFENIADKGPIFKKGIKASAWAILASVVFGAVAFGGAQLLQIELPGPAQWLMGGVVMDVFNTSLAVIYSCALALLFQKEKWQKRLIAFYFVGRMGLTTYLLQTALGVIVFFGIGFGLLGDVGATLSAGISIVFFLLQVQFSKWWLSRFKFGLFEWLWRSLTWLRLQPIKS
jgi:uncharacterized protein